MRNQNGNGKTESTKSPEQGVKTWLCHGTFDDAMLKSFMEFYNGLLKDKETQAIIYIDSNGGAVHTADAIISIIENSSVDFYTCAIGNAHSSALALLVSGRKRFATDRARMLFHDVSFGAIGKVGEVNEKTQDAKEVSKRFLKAIAVKTNKSIEWWLAKAKKRETKDFLFSAHVALKFGVIDRIGLPEVMVVKKVS